MAGNERLRPMVLATGLRAGLKNAKTQIGVSFDTSSFTNVIGSHIIHTTIVVVRTIIPRYIRSYIINSAYK